MDRNDRGLLSCCVDKVLKFWENKDFAYWLMFCLLMGAGRYLEYLRISFWGGLMPGEEVLSPYIRCSEGIEGIIDLLVCGVAALCLSQLLQHTSIIVLPMRSTITLI